MGKFLTREQVVADFKLNLLPAIIKEVGKDFGVIEHCWDVNLEDLEKNNKISTFQKNKWKVTKKELNLS